MDDKKPPAQMIRIGAIKATIWANETKNGTMHNVQVARLWKDGGDWKTSDSFRCDDLPVIQKVLDRAYIWILKAEGKIEQRSSTQAA